MRLSVLDPGGSDQVDRPENEWPLAWQEWRTLYLNPGEAALSEELPAEQGVVRYQSDDATSSVVFTVTFDEDTEITGYLNLHLWVEAKSANDMDLFAAVYKTDAEDNRLHHIEVQDEQMRAAIAGMKTDGRLPAKFGYDGPSGRLRVSHRAVDPQPPPPSPTSATPRSNCSPRASASRSNSRCGPPPCSSTPASAWWSRSLATPSATSPSLRCPAPT